jgi:hypothetical protein
MLGAGGIAMDPAMWRDTAARDRAAVAAFVERTRDWLGSGRGDPPGSGRLALAAYRRCRAWGLGPAADAALEGLLAEADGDGRALLLLLRAAG